MGFQYRKLADGPHGAMYLVLFGLHLAVTTQGCDSGWRPHGQSCYKASVGKVNFAASRDGCSQAGARLITITSQEESNFIKDFIINFNNRRPSWIGMKHGSQGYYWIDNTPVTFENYLIPEQIYGECVSTGRLDQNFKWTRQTCVSKYSYICEKDNISGFSTTVASFPDQHTTAVPRTTYWAGTEFTNVARSTTSASDNRQSSEDAQEEGAVNKDQTTLSQFPTTEPSSVDTRMTLYDSADVTPGASISQSPDISDGFPTTIASFPDQHTTVVPRTTYWAGTEFTNVARSTTSASDNRQSSEDAQEEGEDNNSKGSGENSDDSKPYTSAVPRETENTHTSLVYSAGTIDKDQPTLSQFQANEPSSVDTRTTLYDSATILKSSVKSTTETSSRPRTLSESTAGPAAESSTSLKGIQTADVAPGAGIGHSPNISDGVAGLLLVDRGFYYEAESVWTAQVRSLIECAIRCCSQSICVTFQYHTYSGTCRMFSHTFEHSAAREASLGWALWWLSSRRAIVYL